jgi:hypothetical protein
MKKKKKITVDEVNEIVKQSVSKSNKKDSLYHLLVMLGGITLSVLMLYLLFPAKVYDLYWLGGFMLIGLVVGTWFYARVIMKKSYERSLSSILNELRKEVGSRTRK